MKERSIIFKAEEVRAILAGRKTQARRVVKRHRCSPHLVFLDYGSGWWPFESNDGESPVMGYGCEYPLTCPFGKPGDRLWVKETYALHHMDGDGSHPLYRADLTPKSAPPEGYDFWIPSAQMPRWASRILLEVMAVRVERLQDISEADAQAEGATGQCPVGNLRIYNEAPLAYHFAQIWEQAHPNTWDQNPWVWVIEFRRVEP